MHNGDPHLGESVLTLLADGATLAIIRELADGPLRPGDLERRTDLPHSGLMRRLRRLAVPGIIARKRHRESPPRTHYALTDSGRELLGIPNLAMRWERSWHPDNGWRRQPSESWVLHQIADGRTHALMLALADGPLRPRELERHVPGLGHSAIMRRLGTLTQNGIVVRRAAPDGRREVRYELTDQARRLGLLVMLAARWEWRWARPRDSAVTGNLPGLLRIIAPLARIPEDLQGTCRVHFDARSARRRSSVDLAADAGRVVALAQRAEPPTVEGRSDPQAWCDSLLAGHLLGIAVNGDRELLATVLEGLQAALLI